MKIILVAGGSGGHIYPCMELAKYLKSKGNDILLVGSKNSMEEKIYSSSEFKYELLDISKKKIKSLVINYQKIENIYEKFKPDILLLFGNYISFSFALVGYKRKIPIYLHEQNIIYGRANKFIGMFAKRIYLSLPIKKNHYKKKSLLVGNPKADLENIKKVNLDKSKKNVFIVMGSLGSESVNETLLNLIKISDSNYRYHIITGKKHYDEFVKNATKHNNVFIYPYLESLVSYLREADLVVSRSGATTLLEIINYNIPSLLIPSPYVKDNHQYKNAKYLLDNKATVIINEKDLNALNLKRTIESLLNNKNKLIEIKNNLKKLSCNNSKELIYKDILKYEN